jgi:hypothetical protein
MDVPAEATSMAFSVSTLASADLRLHLRSVLVGEHLRKTEDAARATYTTL